MITSNDDVVETTLLRGQLAVFQPRAGFHASTDTILLGAAAIPFADDANTVLDVGCGVGSVGLYITLKNKNILLTGIDIQSEMTALAVRNATLNGLSDRCNFHAGSIEDDDGLTVQDRGFDLVVTNPPFQAGGRHVPSPYAGKALAHGEEASGIDLSFWCKYLHRKLKQGGRMVMIHRADRLDEIIGVLTARRWFGSLMILPVHPRAGEPAKRVIITARKERYAPLVLKSGLVMHEADGTYTPTATDILDGKSFLFL